MEPGLPGEGQPTQAERAAALLWDAIIRGDLPPGVRLGIRNLSERYEIGPTPLREALASLSGRGVVVAVGQRGFRVAPASEADLEDLMTVRTLVETEALRRAIQQGGDEWEARIVSSLHLLQRFSSDPPANLSERMNAFERLNKGFHAALVSACGSKRLLALIDDLHDQTRRYRSLMLRSRDISRDAYQEHVFLAERVLARDAEAACAELADHNRIAVELIYGGRVRAPGGT